MQGDQGPTMGNVSRGTLNCQLGVAYLTLWGLKWPWSEIAGLLGSSSPDRDLGRVVLPARWQTRRDSSLTCAKRG